MICYVIIIFPFAKGLLSLKLPRPRGGGGASGGAKITASVIGPLGYILSDIMKLNCFNRNFRVSKTNIFPQVIYFRG